MKLFLSITALRISWLLSLPILILIFPQALYIKKTTLRLMEARGPKTGLLSGQEPNLRLLHVGESTVAGVGVESIETGLTVNVAKEINAESKREVEWQIHGENGIKLSELLDSLKNHPPRNCDIALITMGVNDTTKLTSLGKWKSQIDQTIELLKPLTQGVIVFTQVPPMIQFPALPAPLKYFLGLRSTLLDLTLKEACQKHSQVYYVSSKPKMEPDFMAEDGYHPSAQGYSEWAKSISPKILKSYQQGLNGN